MVRRKGGRWWKILNFYPDTAECRSRLQGEGNQALSYSTSFRFLFELIFLDKSVSERGPKQLHSRGLILQHFEMQCLQTPHRARIRITPDEQDLALNVCFL